MSEQKNIQKMLNEQAAYQGKTGPADFDPKADRGVRQTGPLDFGDGRNRGTEEQKQRDKARLGPPPAPKKP